MRVMVTAGGFNYLAEGPPTLKAGDRVLVESEHWAEHPFAATVVDVVPGVGAPRRVLEVLTEEEPG